MEGWILWRLIEVVKLDIFCVNLLQLSEVKVKAKQAKTIVGLLLINLLLLMLALARVAVVVGKRQIVVTHGGRAQTPGWRLRMFLNL